MKASEARRIANKHRRDQVTAARENGAYVDIVNQIAAESAKGGYFITVAFDTDEMVVAALEEDGYDVGLTDTESAGMCLAVSWKKRQG